MASSTDFRRIFHDIISDPMDVARALDALEDICHEASSEVEHAWQERGAGAPWRAVRKIIGSTRIKVKTMLKRRFGYP